MKLEKFRRFCNGGFDWYADADIPADFHLDGGEWWVRFAYYDTSGCLSGMERELYERGYDFDCYVTLINDNEYGHGEWTLAHFAAPWAEAAEEYLQLAADALYREEE